MSNFIQVTPFMHVQDIDRAVYFFVDVLGFKALWHASSTYAYVERESIGIRILKASATEGEVPGPGTKAFRYYVDVKDVDTLYKEMKPRVDAMWNGQIHGPVDQEYGQREFMIVAPDGDLIVFGQSIFAMPSKS